MDNLELYKGWANVPKEAQKPFDNGTFKGTDINTMWRIKVLTERFGPCGVGWYFNIKRVWSESLGDQCGEILSNAEIELFIKYNGEWSKPIAGIGGNKMLSYIKSRDSYKPSDEAYKMAVTDAFGNACRNLGIGANVYWANDKTKYDSFDNSTSLPSLKEVRRMQIIDIQKKTGITNAELKALATECGCIDLEKADKQHYDNYITRLKNWSSEV